MTYEKLYCKENELKTVVSENLWNRNTDADPVTLLKVFKYYIKIKIILYSFKVLVTTYKRS